MAASMQQLLTHKRVLLLQGKMGGSFHRLATLLKQNNIDVGKVNLNAADEFFYRHDQSYNYTDTLDNFTDWLQALITTHNIDAVVCFGDSRPYHIKAAELSQQMSFAFFVFEEGYLRPDYITLEQYGVNGNSRLDVDAISTLPKANDHPLYTYNRYYKVALVATFYHTWNTIFRYRFPHYKPHRGMSLWEEAKGSLFRGSIRKLLSYFPDKWLQDKLVSTASERYFLVSLQVHIDSQISHHSDYNDITDFIAEIIADFSQNAELDDLLVFKHHPLDRGYRNYTKLIRQLAESHHVEGRIFYGCDMHLPTLIKHSKGMVTINSTTGLQSIYHKKPTKVMGRAIYNIAQLTDQQPLAQFWKKPTPPNYEFYGKFREYLIEQTQLNGSFHGRSPWMKKYLPISTDSNKTTDSNKNNK